MFLAARLHKEGIGRHLALGLLRITFSHLDSVGTEENITNK